MYSSRNPSYQKIKLGSCCVKSRLDLKGRIIFFYDGIWVLSTDLFCPHKAYMSTLLDYFTAGELEAEMK